MWLFLVQPQRRRRQRQAQLLTELKAGDEVMTAGGLFGTIREVGENDVVLEIAPDTRVRLVKGAITSRIEPSQEAAEPQETSLP
jgi:preprotein translocase subunit YajC